MAEYDAITQWFYERDIWSAQQYREYLNGRLDDFEEYSEGYREVSDKLRQIDEDEAARRKKLLDDQAKAYDDYLRKLAEEQKKADDLMDNRFDFGEVSVEEYRKYWQARLAILDQSTDEAYNIRRKLRSLDEEEKKTQEEIAKKQEEQLKFLEQIAALREAVQKGFEGVPAVQFFLDGQQLIGSLKRAESLNGNGWRAG